MAIDTLQVAPATVDPSLLCIAARIEAAKREILCRTLQMIVGAGPINIIAMVGIMFALAKLLGH